MKTKLCFSSSLKEFQVSKWHRAAAFANIYNRNTNILKVVLFLLLIIKHFE